MSQYLKMKTTGNQWGEHEKSPMKRNWREKAPENQQSKFRQKKKKPYLKNKRVKVPIAKKSQKTKFQNGKS